MSLNDFEAGPEIKMKGSGENDFGADLLEVLRRHRLDRAVGAHGHECRGLDGPARQIETAAARCAILREQRKTHPPKRRAGAQADPAACAAGVRNIASP